MKLLTILFLASFKINSKSYVLKFRPMKSITTNYKNRIIIAHTNPQPLRPRAPFEVEFDNNKPPCGPVPIPGISCEETTCNPIRDTRDGSMMSLHQLVETTCQTPPTTTLPRNTQATTSAIITPTTTMTTTTTTITTTTPTTKIETTTPTVKTTEQLTSTHTTTVLIRNTSERTRSVRTRPKRTRQSRKRVKMRYMKLRQLQLEVTMTSSTWPFDWQVNGGPSEDADGGVCGDLANCSTLPQIGW